MKQNILDRYDINEDGKSIIKISTNKVEDLYNEFDRESSFLKKDLDEELVEYIIDSVSEIGKEEFCIKFYFDERVDIKRQNKIKNSIKEYFTYLGELEKRKMSEQIKNSMIFMIIGLVFTTFALLTGDSENIIVELLSEGMMVAGWVSLWEALATFLIKWLPLTKKLKLFKRVLACDVLFNDTEQK